MLDWTKLASFCYDQARRYKWIYAPYMTLLSRSRLAVEVGFWRPFPRTQILLLLILNDFIFLGRRFCRIGRWISMGKIEPNCYPLWAMYLWSPVFSKRGHQHCTRCGLDERRVLVLWHSYTQDSTKIKIEQNQIYLHKLLREDNWFIAYDRWPSDSDLLAVCKHIFNGIFYQTINYQLQKWKLNFLEFSKLNLLILLFHLKLGLQLVRAYEC